MAEGDPRHGAADELRVRTWSRETRPAEVWAVLRNWSLTDDERVQLARRLGWLQEDED